MGAKVVGGERLVVKEEYRRSAGTGTDATMYLYIIACLSNSFHCAAVNGNPIAVVAIPPATQKPHL